MKRSLLSELSKAEEKPDSGWSFYSATDSPENDDVSLVEVDTISEKNGSQESDSSLTGSPKCRSEEDKSPSDYKSAETTYRIPKKGGNKQLASLGFLNSFHSNLNGKKTGMSPDSKHNKPVPAQARPSLRRGTHNPDAVASRLNRQRSMGRTTKQTRNLSTRNTRNTRSSPKCSQLSEFTSSDKVKTKQGCEASLLCSSRWRHAEPPLINRKVQCADSGDDDILEVLGQGKDERLDVEEISVTKSSSICTRTRSRFKKTSKACNDTCVKELDDDESLHSTSNNSIMVLNGHGEDRKACDEDILTSVNQNSTYENSTQSKEKDDSSSGSDFEDIYSCKQMCSRCLTRHNPGKCQRTKLYDLSYISCAATPREALHKESNTISTNFFYGHKNASDLKQYEQMRNSTNLDIEWKEMPSEKNKTNLTRMSRATRRTPPGTAKKRRKQNESDSDTSGCKPYQLNQKRKSKTQNNQPTKMQAVVITLDSDEEEEKEREIPDDEKPCEPFITSDEKLSATASQTELEEGQLEKPKPSRRISSKKATSEKKDQEHDKESVDGFERDNLNLNILLGKTVRIGRIVSFPTAPLEVTSSGITLNLKREASEFTLSISEDEIESLQINPEVEPRIIVLAVNQKCALRIKSWARIRGKGFDPGSMVQAERNIVLEVAEEIPPETRADLMDWVKEKLCKSYSEISPVKAEEILNMISVPEGQATNNQASSFVEPNRYRTRLRNSQRLSITVHEPVKNLITYPQPPVQGGITVTSRDAECLTPGEFMNDVVIDFYLKYIFHEKLSDAYRQRTHIFSSYFYKRLTQKHRHGNQDEIILSSPDRMHKQVHKWTRNVDIFEKDFLIVPVNQSLHWFLAIICFPSQEAPGKVGRQVEVEDDEEEEEEEEEKEKAECQKNKVDEARIDSEDDDSDFDSKEGKSLWAGPKAKLLLKTQPSIIIFDSLGGCGRGQVFGNLRHYLSAEWRERRQKQHGPREFSAETIKGSYAKVPLQDNHCDCGVFLLQYVESFFEDPITDYRETPIKKVDWFPLSKITQKRQNILDLIHELNKQHKQQQD